MAIVGADSAGGDPVSQHIELLKGVERMANTNRDVANSVNDLRNVVVEVIRRSESSVDKLRSSMEHQIQTMVDHFKGVEAKKLLEKTNEQSEAVADLADRSTPKADKVSQSINKEISELAEASSKLTTLLEKAKGGNTSESIDKMLTNNQRITAIEAALNSIADHAIANTEAQLQANKIDQQKIDEIYAAIAADREARAKALEIQQKEGQKAQTLEERLARTRQPNEGKSGRGSLLGMFGSLLGLQKGFYTFSSGIFGKMLLSLGKAALIYELVETGVGLLRLITKAGNKNEEENRADSLKGIQRYDHTEQQAYKTVRKSSGKSAPKIDALFSSTPGFGNVETVRESIKAGKIDLNNTEMLLGIAKKIALQKISQTLRMIMAVANKDILTNAGGSHWDKSVNELSGIPFIGENFMAKEARFSIIEWCNTTMDNASKIIDGCKTPGEVQSALAEIVHQIMINGSALLQTMSNGKNFLTEQQYEQLASQVQETNLAIAELDPVTYSYASSTEDNMMKAMQKVQSANWEGRLRNFGGDPAKDKKILMPADQMSQGVVYVTEDGEEINPHAANARAKLEQVLTSGNFGGVAIIGKEKEGFGGLFSPYRTTEVSKIAPIPRWDSEGDQQRSLVFGENEVVPASPFHGMTDQQRTQKMLSMYEKGDQQFKQEAAEGKFGTEMQELSRQIESLDRHLELLGRQPIGQKTELDKVVGALRDVINIAKQGPTPQPVNINMPPMVKIPIQPQRR